MTRVSPQPARIQPFGLTKLLMEISGDLLTRLNNLFKATEEMLFRGKLSPEQERRYWQGL
jgi:hypothetical protein